MHFYALKNNGGLKIRYKKIIFALTFILVVFAVTGVVSAAANVTDDAVGIEETGNEIVSVDETNIDYSKINESNSDFMNYNLSVLSTNDNSQTLGIKETHFDDFRYGDTFSSLLNVPLRDANNNLIYNEKVIYSFDNTTTPVEYLSHLSIKMPSDLKKNAYHFITLKYGGSSTYAPCEKVIAFKYVSGRFGTIVNQIPTKLEFELVNFNIYHDSMKVYLKDGLGNIFSKLDFTYVFDNNGTVFQQRSNANGNTIKLNFAPSTKHSIKLNFYGNDVFKKCEASKTFSIDSSIQIKESESKFVEGGKNIPCYLYYKNGNLKEVKTLFAPFGKSKINITNDATGQTIVATFDVYKLDLKLTPLYADYEDILEYKIRLIENDQYVTNKNIYLNVGGEEINATLDDNGFAIVKIHLKADTYRFIVRYANNTQSDNIHINPVYVGNKYRNMYLSVNNAYYGESIDIDYGWEGNLDGYIKIYNGNSEVYSKNFNTGGIVSDYLNYEKHQYELTKQFPVGSYVVKILANDGTVLKTSSFKIIKAPTYMQIGSKTAKTSKKVTISNEILDKNTLGRAKTANGQVTLTINGKTYSAKVKNGKFSISFKAPSKAKKYTSKLIYSGDSNYKGSSKTFKIIVKKGSSVKKTTTKKTTNSNVKKITLKFTNSRSSGKYVKNTYVYVGYGDIYGQYVRTDTHNGVKGITFIKANVYFKNNRNGKTIVKTKKLDKWGYSKTKLISGYTPNKVIIFYK